MVLSRDIKWFKSIGKQSCLLVEKTWIGNGSKVHSWGKYLEQGSVVQAELKLWVAKEEELTLFNPPGSSSSFPADRAVPLFCSGAESTTNKDSLPA